MKRLYYLTHDINAAERVSEKLHQQGVSDWHFHVLGKDKANMIKHHLHLATPLQELDIIRSGERGALIGFGMGILLTGGLVMLPSYSSSLGLFTQVAMVLLFSLFGAWVGGLVGVSNENYKIRRFHDYIEHGQFLLMIDVERSQRPLVQSVVASFAEVRKAGEDTTITTPFDKIAA